MSAGNKTRLEVQKILIDSISAGLAYLNETGWGIMEFANASFIKADKIILVNLINARRIGWQAFSFPMNQQVLGRKDEWIEEQSWQVHTLCKRVDNGAANDARAEDVATNLVAWFNGPGCDELRRHGVANIRIDSAQILVYNDNSNLYQKRAVFTVKIQTPKELTASQPDVEATLPKVKPV